MSADGTEQFIVEFPQDTQQDSHRPKRADQAGNALPQLPSDEPQSQNPAMTAGTAAPYPQAHTAASQQDSMTLFQRWFVNPLEKLRAERSGDGGFVALAVSCFLYERYARAIIKEGEPKRTDQCIHTDDIAKQLMHDLGLQDEQLCNDFWTAIRHGLAHHAMPQLQNDKGEPLPRWRLSAEYKSPVQLDTCCGDKIIGVQPWLFMDKILELWQQRPDLIKKDEAAPWGAIF